MTEHVELQNEELQVVIAPAEGGRIVSLMSRASGLEFLYQSLHPFVPVVPSRTASFQQGPCGGIEECLPTVACCEIDGELVPDHGDFWQLEWHLIPSTFANGVRLSADGFSRPLRVTKEISLREARLHIDYEIQNIGNETVFFHYATHPLLAIEAGDRIHLPDEVKELKLLSSCSNRLGKPGDLVSWPLVTQAEQEDPFDISRLLDAGAGTADMLYSSRLTEGWCGLYRTQWQQGVVLKFSPSRLPYLGLWVCCGGWPEDANGSRQFAFAPEPTTAPCPSLEAAQNEGKAISLRPKDLFHFDLEFCVSPQCNQDEFHSFCYSNDTV